MEIIWYLWQKQLQKLVEAEAEMEWAEERMWSGETEIADKDNF